MKEETESEKAIREIEENIVKVVKNNPGISTREVMERQMKRMIKRFYMPPEQALKAFTTALGRRLGEDIQCNGKQKKIGKYTYQQLTIFNP